MATCSFRLVSTVMKLDTLDYTIHIISWNLLFAKDEFTLHDGIFGRRSSREPRIAVGPMINEEKGGIDSGLCGISWYAGAWSTDYVQYFEGLLSGTPS
jgi:hypothetical protein